MILATDIAMYLVSIISTIIINKIKFPAIIAKPDSIQIYERIPTTKNDKLLNFSAGAGYWIYYLGIVKFIQEEKYDLTDTDFVGTSAGAFACSACAFNVPADIMLQQSLLHIKRCRDNWLDYNSNWMVSTRIVVLDTLKQSLTTKPTANQYIGVSKLTMNGFQKRYFGGKLTPDALATALQTSSWLPFITSPLFQPSLYVCDAPYCDGFLTGKDKAPHAKQLVICPNKLERLPLYTYWLWLGHDYNTMLYNKGYEHAKKHRKLFDDFFT